MYSPPHFAEDRISVLHGLIHDHPLAALVTLGSDGLVADHIPMEIDPDPAPRGTLRGHVSRANPVWHTHPAEVEALAIFQGPQAYVTPAWYPAKQETGKVVPTWNYAVVHVRGPLRPIEDRDWLRALVERLTARHEMGRLHPWQVTDAPRDYIEAQLEGIVGIEVPITRIEGKWKVSQNRSAADRAGVVAGLRATEDPTGRAVADLVEGAARRARGR